MKVTERVCTGRFARWMYRRGWHAVTLPWGRDEARILYWTTAGEVARDHEYTVHPPQIERMGGFCYVVCWTLCFGVLALRYLSLFEAHRRHPMEWGPP